MTKQFEERVVREGIVDTRVYRYVYTAFADHAEIRRIKIEFLDTTNALNGWEVVKIFQ